MDLSLFAQQNNAAFQAGQLIGWGFAILLCASIPLSVGFQKGQPLLGVIGAVCAAGGAFLLGCLLGLPIALVFAGIITAVSNSQPQRRPSDYDDDYDDRPRRRGRDDEDDDYDDRPRRRQRDDNW